MSSFLFLVSEYFVLVSTYLFTCYKIFFFFSPQNAAKKSLHSDETLMGERWCVHCPGFGASVSCWGMLSAAANALQSLTLPSLSIQSFFFFFLNFPYFSTPLVTFRLNIALTLGRMLNKAVYSVTRQVIMSYCVSEWGNGILLNRRIDYFCLAFFFFYFSSGWINTPEYVLYK